MKLAVPIWNDRVSIAFDFAHRLLLVDKYITLYFDSNLTIKEIKIC